MQREIKFRGKRVSLNDWLYGYLREVYGWDKRAFVISPAKRFDTGDCTDLDEDCVQADTIGQFTGLYDKNGKEIYEGDIIKTPLGHVGVVEFGKAVEYCTHKECGRMITDAYTTYGWLFNGKIKVGIDDEILNGEVIGNIFDNKELLEQLKDER